MSISKQKQLRLGGRLLVLLGLILAFAAVLLVIHDRQTEPKPPADALTSRAAPSSVKPGAKAVAGYTVPLSNPKYISIPAIGLSNTRIVKLGLASGGAIAAPSNIYDTGWYDGSATPGQPGAMFIYGHVSSWTANGAFYNLKKLQPGDRITITRGDNKTFTYAVVASKIYDYQKVDMSAVLSPIDPQKPGLNLMTCTGEIIKGTSEFNKRLVIFAEQV